MLARALATKEQKRADPYRERNANNEAENVALLACSYIHSLGANRRLG